MARSLLPEDMVNQCHDVAARKSEMLKRILGQNLPLGRQLDAARGVCKNYLGYGKRRCNKSDACPYLHIKKGQPLHLATNRHRAPFLQFDTEGRLMPVPPAKQVVHLWW